MNLFSIVIAPLFLAIAVAGVKTCNATSCSSASETDSALPRMRDRRLSRQWERKIQAEGISVEVDLIDNSGRCSHAFVPHSLTLWFTMLKPSVNSFFDVVIVCWKAQRSPET